MKKIKKLTLILFLLTASSALANEQEAKLGSFRDLLVLNFSPAFRLSSGNFISESSDPSSIKNFFNQSRFAIVGLDFSWQWFELYVAFDIMPNWANFNNNRFFSNLPLGDISGSIHMEIPVAAFVAYRSDLVDFSVGRRRWHVGPGNYSLIASRDVLFFDGFWLSVRPQLDFGRFHFYFMAASDDHIALRRFLNWQREAAGGSRDPNLWFNPVSEQRWFFIGRLAISTDNWQLGITETMLWHGRPLDLHIFNPLFWWHNLNFPGYSNVTLGIDFEKILPIAQNVKVFGQFNIDDIRAPNEGVGETPTSLALYVGALWQVFEGNELFSGPVFNPFGQLISTQRLNFPTGGLIVGFDAVWTSRFMWTRRADRPLGKFTMFKLADIWAASHSPSIIEHFLAFPYGNDNIYFKASGQWQNSNWFS